MTWNPLKKNHLSTKLSFTPSVVDRAEDQQLEALYFKLHHVEETSRRLQKDMKKYVEYLNNVCKAEQKITSDLSSSQICVQDDTLRRLVEEYHSAAAKETEYVAEFAETSQKCFQEPLKKFVSIFATIETAFQHREHLVQEWRNLSAKVKKLEEKDRTGSNIVKLEKERKALAAVSDALISNHSALLSDVKYFLDKRPEFFRPILEALMRSQLEYHGNLTTMFTLLSKMSNPSVSGSPSIASVPEKEYQASVNEKLNKLKALSIVKKTNP